MKYLLIAAIIVLFCNCSKDEDTITPLRVVIDLNVGETQEVILANGEKATVTLKEINHSVDNLRSAVRSAYAHVVVNGDEMVIEAANYNLPVTLGSVQIDCPVTKAWVGDNRQTYWKLEKDARLRLWPKGTPFITPGTFVYPVKQRWFASDTQMGNEPTYVDGGERPDKTNVYYHSGLDFGGAEGLVKVVAAADGIVVSAQGNVLKGHVDSPVKPRDDVVYMIDKRGWYYRYSHLNRVDVKSGQKVQMGEPIGLIGKEGSSGGWSHLHFNINSRLPSGEWGIQDAYAYIWQAYQQEYHPDIIAVARPHQLAAVGDSVVFNGTKSWSSSGKILHYEWSFYDGSVATGPAVMHTYSKPGSYSEILKVTDINGNVAWDFKVVQVLDSAKPQQLPPAIHAAYYPTTNIQPGDPVKFMVRTFRTTANQEEWDFGDGSVPIKVKSDGNVDMHAKNGYAETEHRFKKPGNYIVRVERSNESGEIAVAHLIVNVGE